MRTANNIPTFVRDQQTAVSNPNVSAWVAANAGSGKTHVLAQRVINHLLSGVAPAKILCLTFTKAAAANMSKRVFDTLAHWTTMGDAELDAAIAERSNLAPDATRRALARRLFALALETPGGLKVQTVHAFCTQLLHRFPFEANVAARFAVLDEAEQTQLLEQLTLDVLLDGAAEPAGALGRALAAAMIAAADQTFRDVVREAVGRREAIGGWIIGAGGVNAAIAGLSNSLRINPSDTREAIDAELFSGSSIEPNEWRTIAAMLAAGSKNDINQSHRFATLTLLSGDELIDKYVEIFCTDAGTPRHSIVTKAIRDGGLRERLGAEQERVCRLLERRRAVACRDRSAALLTVAHEVLTRYGKEKQRRGVLDYDDLIDNSLDLLRDGGASWVHYKLDLGIDHLLIDEAQDTSRKQWEIVTHLAAEFFAGAGARGVPRTVFAVGDEKQSIYSFQNAAPREFAEMRRHFQRAHDAGGLKFVFQEFKHSFRSGGSVLGAVDEVFKNNEIARSVTADADGFPPHIALPDAPPSLVELWEPERADDRPPMEGWDAPFDEVNETSPRVKLARRIAGRVRRMIDDGISVGSERRVVCYGDILILVRQRGELFEAIIRALKNQDVKVAGADRLVLTEHIAVMDLIALADALLLPQDDLALATVLRSPLFDFSDDDLFAAAFDRGRLSLRAALTRRARDNPKFESAAAAFDRLAEAARNTTPFGFFAGLLGNGGRRRFLARLGAEANDALDEFLNLALDYERRQTPSLQGFLAWLRQARAQIKRDMEIARDEVRVMTVHGSKGLEAPVVILADTMTQPAGPPRPLLLKLDNNVMIWAGAKADDVAPVATARVAALAEAEDEYRRLLYVAMTRAADRLIICGADGQRSRPKGCWYNLVNEALKPLLVKETENGETVWRYRKAAPGPAAEPVVAVAPSGKILPPKLPDWLFRDVSVTTPRPQPLTPSSALDEETGRAVGGAGDAAARRKALAKGRIVHRLMQSLPDIAPARRGDAARRYLGNAAGGFSAQEQDEIATRVLAILDSEGFAELFAPGSQAEVPIVGRITDAAGTPRPIAGQVDRLVVTGDSVLIADYKTDRSVPAGLDEVKPYVAQLALYRAVLARLYPGRRVRGALVFTEGPALIEAPAAAMQAALEEVLAYDRHAAVRSLDPGRHAS